MIPGIAFEVQCPESFYWYKTYKIYKNYKTYNEEKREAT